MFVVRKKNCYRKMDLKKNIISDSGSLTLSRKLLNCYFPFVSDDCDSGWSFSGTRRREEENNANLWCFTEKMFTKSRRIFKIITFFFLFRISFAVSRETRREALHEFYLLLFSHYRIHVCCLAFSSLDIAQLADKKKTL